MTLNAGTSRIYLVGLMGAGKSTVGRPLGVALNRPYVDNDQRLIEATGQTAADLASSAPASLHPMESRLLRDLLQQPGPYVASVAASIADNAADQGALQQAGVVVYLRAQPWTLQARVTNASNRRPWLVPHDLQTIHLMYVRRDPVFESIADLVVNVDDISAADIVNQILEQLPEAVRA